MVSVIFAVLGVSFWALTTVVKLCRKFLTLIFAVLLPFLLRDAMLSRHAVSVRLSVTFVHSVKTNKYTFKIFSPSGTHTILFSRTKRYSSILTGNLSLTGVGEGWGGRMHVGILTQYLALSHAAKASCYQHDCRPIPGYRSMPAGASAINWRWSVQWCVSVTVQVCLRHRKPRTSEYSEEKRT